MELVIILLVLVMLFGATRLKDLGGSLGQGIKEFRSAVKDEEDEAPAAKASASTEVPGVEKPNTPPQNGDAHPAGEVIAAVKCPSCGSLNAQGAKFCNSCGAAIATPVSN
jgi:sec-independent protein translocase protein TatA